MCSRWFDSYEDFLADMGRRPSPQHTIDRIDTNGNYEPSNCRWATRLVQGNNTRRNRMLVHGGRTMSAAEWARDVGLDSRVLHRRLRLGWSTERALTEPVSGKHSRRRTT